MDYKKAGVDIHAGYEAVHRMKKHVQSTFTDHVIGGLGGFGGLFSIAMAKEMEEPVLVAGTDGVGTKLKLAIDMNKNDTIGIDCVAMCVNDILCQGAKPLFFLDYIATGKLLPEQAEEIVAGIAEGCRQANTALIGGETAEMPGFYQTGDYDVAGFCVGIVDRAKAIDGSQIKAGDILLGIASSGVHSNGFSLVRKILADRQIDLMQTLNEQTSPTVGEMLLAPTRIYYQALMPLIEQGLLKGLAHITGGGFYENIPRMLPAGVMAEIKKDSYQLPEVFQLLQKWGNLEWDSMYNTFNMGIGMVLAVAAEKAEQIKQDLNNRSWPTYEIGKVIAGDGGVKLC
ncbi:phosphoribosylformylglycinamidine cyclo-ligase [Clostridiales bacterium COT073_COT-073]|nr:phosphoribosylformylglycinamidine cyclo-ligase [Clostridiales bacterium COT073_COT-073]